MNYRYSEDVCICTEIDPDSSLQLLYASQVCANVWMYS